MTEATLEREYGLASPEQAASLSGREFLEAMIAGKIPAPPSARTLSFEIIEVGDGYVRYEGRPGPHLLNPLGVVHGGWALTLIDTVTACAVHSRLPAGVGYTTIETKANFSRAIRSDTGPVRAEAKVVTLGRQIGTAEGWLKDGEGRVLAHGTSTIMIFAPR
ncbi:MAG: phenylacetic acid degradation protein [Phenylobacterium sp.]|uniref:PaaI family thioesterase n=1 Tax=Phenylobacterium sp. TaxID=1871053 RepID=UPI0025E96F65|nr:PaaI family thioesterase [Phenylobacterium sp.]MBA4011408.1 phenylacetic acid degradation protein [Phenylobacterium sp.]